MFDQKINLQLFGEEDFTDISGAEVSESAEDTAESMESVAETTAEDNADDNGESNAPNHKSRFAYFRHRKNIKAILITLSVKDYAENGRKPKDWINLLRCWKCCKNITAFQMNRR